MEKAQEIKTFINQWMLSYKSLNELLIQEQKALEVRDFTLLDKIVKSKNELINLINEQPIPSVENQAANFQENLALNNITPIKETALTKLNKAKIFCMNSVSLKTAWLDLIELVKDCQYRNEVNSKMVELITTSTKRTFNLIKGFDPDNNLYNQEPYSEI